MLQLVHQLDLFQHVGPVGPVLVHLQHHHLAGHLHRQIGDLDQDRNLTTFIIIYSCTIFAA